MARLFEDLKLQPMGTDGFLQPFEAPGRASYGSDNGMVFHHSGGETVLERDKHFQPFGLSGNGSAKGPLVFAGYGIRSEEHGYDDYAGLDVRGKVVLILRHEPQEKDPQSKFDGTGWTRV
jgi:hypothetical protein